MKIESRLECNLLIEAIEHSLKCVRWHYEHNMPMVILANYRGIIAICEIEANGNCNKNLPDQLFGYSANTR
jgi:hypothetical protein